MTSSPEHLSPLLSALDKLPPFHGLSYRGYAGRQSQAHQRAIPSGVLVATSRDPRVATESFSTDGVYAVIGRRGRDISQLSRHPLEQEVVFRPGSIYLPIERFDIEELEVAIVEELDPDIDRSGPPELTLDELEDQIREAIRGARSRPAVDLTTPGKFAGPLT
jgi:hypothetical protein